MDGCELAILSQRRREVGPPEPPVFRVVHDADDGHRGVHPHVPAFSDRDAVAIGSGSGLTAFDLDGEQLTGEPAIVVRDVDVAVLAKVVAGIDRLKDPRACSTPRGEEVDGLLARDPRVRHPHRGQSSTER